METEQLREQLSKEVKAAQAEVRVMTHDVGDEDDVVMRMTLAMRMMLIVRMMLVLRMMLNTDQSSNDYRRSEKEKNIREKRNAWWNQ